ncbi:unnamed protein product [Effrenium voratum]|uniref:Uncharacterized protein n=1 Tax=Effrenium voratum TaxID=2562239 RepID=A0AA36HVV6_9DINO|nr:unnamed protein product [Effrenium voratum]
METSTSAAQKMTELSPLHSESTFCESELSRRSSDERLSESVTQPFSCKPLIPSRSWEQYECEKLLGTGSYGEVHVAREGFSGRKVALKQINFMGSAHRVDIEREISAMKELDHPNICKIFGTIQTERSTTLIMELCEGEDVFERIRKHGPFNERVAADVAYQAASALHYAHRCGIVHRDIKPENVVFVSFASTRIKVIDWGLCCPMSRTRAIAGSLSYAAPELILAKVTGEKDCWQPAVCDTWSLGVVIVVMLSGKLPFHGTPQQQLKKMKSWDQGISRDRLWLAMSPEVRNLITGVLKISPTERPAVGSILKHPWFQSKAPPVMSKKTADQVLANMHEFSRLGHFYAVCLTAAARLLDCRQEDILHLFRSLDKHGNGRLTLQEFTSGFAKACNADRAELEDLFHDLDKDGSGTLHFTEFFAAGMGSALLEDKALRVVFEALEPKDGTISAQEVRRLLKTCDIKKRWSESALIDFSEEVFSRLDLDDKGAIAAEEFSCGIRTHLQTVARAPRRGSRRGSKSSVQLVGCWPFWSCLPFWRRA